MRLHWEESRKKSDLKNGQDSLEKVKYAEYLQRTDLYIHRNSKAADMIMQLILRRCITCFLVENRMLKERNTGQRN